MIASFITMWPIRIIDDNAYFEKTLYSETNRHKSSTFTIAINEINVRPNIKNILPSFIRVDSDRGKVLFVSIVIKNNSHDISVIYNSVIKNILRVGCSL